MSDVTEGGSDATPTPPAGRRLAWTRIIVVVLAVAVAVAATVWISRSGTSREASTSTTTTTLKPKSSGWTTLVSTPAARPGYAEPGGPQVTTVEPKWNGAPLVMPVVGHFPGYLQVRLPGRPNGSVAWIKSTGLLVTATPYRIIVNLATTHLQLVKAGKLVFSAPVGVGTSQYPTPVGNFFVAFYSAAPIPAYGPVVMVTSAHSNTITDWEGTGDAMVAIHGPLGADRIIGTTGAQVSHGCIRMHRSDQVKLMVVQIGTPISIIG